MRKQQYWADLFLGSDGSAHISDGGRLPSDPSGVVGGRPESGIWSESGPYTLGPGRSIIGGTEPYWHNGTVESGPLSFNLRESTTPHQPYDEICLYVFRSVLFNPGCESPPPAPWVSCIDIYEPELLTSKTLTPQAKRERGPTREPYWEECESTSGFGASILAHRTTCSDARKVIAKVFRKSQREETRTVRSFGFLCKLHPYASRAISCKRGGQRILSPLPR